MPENESKIVRKKLVNITAEMDREIAARVKETHRTEMQVIQDAIMGRMVLSQRSSEILADFAKQKGISRERAFDAFLVEMWEFVQSVKNNSKRR